MILKRGLSLLAILAFTNPAFAQHHAAPHGGGHPAAAPHAAPHAGPQHRMTPQQQQHAFQQQMWNEQLMFESMMKSPGTYIPRRSGAAHSAGGRQPATNNRAQPNANRPQTAANPAQPRNNQGQSKVKQQQQQQKRAESPGNISKQPKHERDKEAKEREAAASKKRKAEENLIRRREAKKGLVASRRPLGTDQPSISLLRTAQTKLSRADHDYAGHRVEAMRHVARALEHLTGSYAFDNLRSGAGNLPQAESDRLLREAENHLRIIESTMGTRTDSLEHHHNARASVAEALRELRIALRIN